jgi:Zn-dependent M16 (insulinase) family peptidase
LILKPFKKEEIPSELAKEDRFAEPLIKEERFMPDLMSEPETQVKLGMTFLCNELNQDPYEVFCMSIMSTLLFDGPNTPFYKKIIEGGLAPNFCPGYGYDSSTKESTFTIGVQGIKLEDMKACEKALYDTLKEVVESGIEERYFETTLHQEEFNAKRTKDHFGLACLSHMVPYALHGGDPLCLFKINEYS